MFIDLAIIAENCYTKYFMRAGILSQLNVPNQRKYPSVAEYVEWMKSMSNVEHLSHVLKIEMVSFIFTKRGDVLNESRLLY